MSHELINRSADLKKLQDEGYDIEIYEGYLIIKRIPYVGDGMQVKRGTIVSKLELAGDTTTMPNEHVALWSGDHPCDHHGAPLTNLVNQPDQTQIRDGLVLSYSFSQRPPNGYGDYHQKMTTYIRILQNEVHVLDPSVSALAEQGGTSIDGELVFHYTDTASSRAGITTINNKLKGHRVAIVGLGGTGSYILDLVAKTPVEEIHLFDDDKFSQHNAFRSPGAPSLDDLRKNIVKVEWFAEIYSRMHKNIISHPQRIDESNISKLNSMSIVFLCVDSGKSRQIVVSHLIENLVPFIDVGIGLQIENSALTSLARITTCTPSYHNHAANRIPYNDGENDEYSNNIQIADMNALNAAFAVIKWKKMCGFYHNLEHEHHTVYGVFGNIITNEEVANEAKDDQP